MVCGEEVNRKNSPRLETQEQIKLIRWRDRCVKILPGIDLLHHISNHFKVANEAMGTLAGIPDLCLPVPRGKYHGCYIELKPPRRGGRVLKTATEGCSSAQISILRKLRARGYYASAIIGFTGSVRYLLSYYKEDKISPTAIRKALEYHDEILLK